MLHREMKRSVVAVDFTRSNKWDEVLMEVLWKSYVGCIGGCPVFHSRTCNRWIRRDCGRFHHAIKPTRFTLLRTFQRSTTSSDVGVQHFPLFAFDDVLQLGVEGAQRLVLRRFRLVHLRDVRFAVLVLERTARGLVQQLGRQRGQIFIRRLGADHLDVERSIMAFLYSFICSCVSNSTTGNEEERFFFEDNTVIFKMCLIWNAILRLKSLWLTRSKFPCV